MTAKEAINVIDQVRRLIVKDPSWLKNVTDAVNEAADMAIKALEEQDVPDTNVGDTISRQAAIYAAIDAADDWDGCTNIGRQKRIENYINKLPSAQQEPPEPEELDFVQPHKKIGVRLEIGQPEKRTEERTETHTCDLISRQDFDKFLEDAEKEAVKNRKYVFASALNTIRGNLRNFPSTQQKSEERTAESAQNVPREDLISRKVAIEAMSESLKRVFPEHRQIAEKCLNALPSAHPTLYGYNIEHLKIIAEVLRKENFPPERVVEALTDIGRIASIIRAEFEEELRKAVERWMI